MAAEGTLTPSATTPPHVPTTAPTEAEPPLTAESYHSLHHPAKLTQLLDLATDAPKPASHIRYRYTKEQMYAIAASKASQIKPPRLPAIVCRYEASRSGLSLTFSSDEPGNLADHKEVERGTVSVVLHS